MKGLKLVHLSQYDKAGKVTDVYPIVIDNGGAYKAEFTGLQDEPVKINANDGDYLVVTSNLGEEMQATITVRNIHNIKSTTTSGESKYLIDVLRGATVDETTGIRKVIKDAKTSPYFAITIVSTNEMTNKPYAETMMWAKLSYTDFSTESLEGQYEGSEVEITGIGGQRPMDKEGLRYSSPTQDLDLDAYLGAISYVAPTTGE